MFDGSQNIIKVAFDTTLEGIILTDSDARVVFVNEAIERSLGYTVDDILGKDMHILIPKLSREKHKHNFHSFFKNPEILLPDNAREIMGVHKDGRLVPLELKISQFSFNGKKYAQAIITDISKRKKKENQIINSKKRLEKEVRKRTTELEKVVKKIRTTNEALEIEIQKKIEAKDKARKALIAERELSQLKTKFLSLASHEFRTPLSGILTSATLIGKYANNNKESVEKHINVIKTIVNHLSNILDDFMSLERIETGDIHYKFSSFDFNNLMKKIVKESNSLLKNGQVINYKPLKDCIEIYQDKRIVQIIISNILFNAIKYSAEFSPIDVFVSSNDYVTIKIADKGIGIPKKDQKNIFERFFRASNVLHLQGTGIGLNIVKANVEGLGGIISFLSEENEGSTFVVKLPKNIVK